MKQEASKTNKKWILPVAIAAAVLVVVGIVLAIIMIPGNQNAGTAQSKLYWNVDRVEHIDPESGLSARPADADGLFTIRYAVDGEQVDLRCADKRLVNILDMQPLVGLVFDADGLIVEALSPDTVATEIAKEFFVRSFDGKNLALNTSVAMSGQNLSIAFTENTKIYDVSADAKTVGEVGQTLGVIDRVSVYGNENGEATHVFRIEAAADAEVYHRLYRKWDKVNKKSSRVPDENGVYTIEYAHRGQLVDMKCRDENVVNKIDQMYDAGAQMGLVLDDEGYIIKTITAGEAIRGKLHLKKVSVTAIDGNTVTFESRFHTNSDVGTVTTMTIPEGLEMYLIEDGCDAHFIGEATTELKIDDRCYVYTDFDDNAKMIFIENRRVDSKMYYNITRMYDSTKQETTRVPENGYYVFEVACEGKQMKVKTRDKALASRLDSFSTGVIGLKLNGSIIEAVYSPSCVTGQGSNSNRFVMDIMSGIVRMVTRDNWESGSNFMLAPNVEIYDVTGNAKVPVGSVTELQPFDWIKVAYANEYNQLTHIYIQQRYVEDSVLIYNTDRQYDSEKKETSRLPDENDYYNFNIVTEGKQMDVKTKDKEIATFIDSNKRPVALKLSGNIIKAAYKPATCVKGGVVTLTGSTFYKMNDYGTAFEYLAYQTGERKTCSYMLSKDLKVYNVGAVFEKKRGEQTTLREGDAIYMVISYQDKQIHKMMVTGGRESNEPLYWHVNRQYNFTTQETAREPDAEDWYVFQFAVDGQIKTFKTKDRLVATKADRRSGAFSIIRNGDIILDVITYPNIKEVAGTIAGGYTITGIKGNTVTAENLNATSATFGDVQKLKLTKKCKIYNVSSYADPFGAVDTLSVGDMISPFTDDDGNVCYVYITAKNTRKAGFESYCEHCDKTVRWTPLTGSIARADMHYYLPCYRESNQIKLGYRDYELAEDPKLKPFETVIDLNGQTFAAKNDRLFRIYSGTLTIMDSVGTGKMLAGVNGSDGGGLIRTSGTDVTINLYSGTLTVPENALPHARGNIFYGSYTLNIYGGAITGGIAQVTETQSKPGGGNIYISGGAINMYGGTISGGTSGKDGRGGNIWARNAELNLYGGTISGGVSAGTGGNIIMEESSVLNMSGGTITGGVSSGASDDVAVGIGAKFNMTGGTIKGEIAITDDLSATFSGKPVIDGKLTVPVGTKIVLGDLVKGASIDVSANGVFTTENKKAADYINYFHTMRESDVIKLTDNKKALDYVVYTADLDAFSNDPLVFEAGTTNAYCPACGIKVTWTALDQATYGQTAYGPVSSHVYLAEDITYTGTATFFASGGAGVSGCIHLNGHDLTTTKATAINGTGGTINIMGNGNVTGYNHRAYNGGAINLDTTNDQAYINVYGGTYYLAEGQESRPIAVGNSHGGHLNLYKDATVVATSRARSALFLGSADDENAELNIYGATIIGNYVIQAAVKPDEFTNTTLIDGATVTGSIVVEGQCWMTLAGDLKVGGALNIADGVKITVGELNCSNPIPVVATGVFTNNMANAAAYVANFVGDGNDTIEVTTDGKALQYVKAVVIPPEEKICEACGKVPEGGWTPITKNSTEEITANGHYYLTRDWKEDSKAGMTMPAYDICLDLNGHSITTDEQSDKALAGRAITVAAGQTINIVGEGTVAPVGTQGAVYVTSGTVNIYNGTYTAPAGQKALYVTGAASTINVKGGTVNGALYVADSGTLSITGGTFDHDPTAYVATGYAATKNGDVWTVDEGTGEQPPVTPPAEVKVCAACNKVPENGWTPITLEGSTSEITADGHYRLDCNWVYTSKGGIQLPNFNICLDLNGHSITGGSTNGRAVTVDKGNTVNIMGNGTVATTGTQGAIYVSNGTVNVYSGTYVGPTGQRVLHVTGANSIVNVNGGTFTGVFNVTNGATLSITGGTFSADPTDYVPTEGYTVTADNGTWTVTAGSGNQPGGEQPGGEQPGEGEQPEIDGNAVNNADLVFAPETTKANCPVCGVEVTWTKVTTDANITAAGHYYVTDEIAVSDADGILVNTTGKVCLHLGSAATVIQSSTDTGRSAITCSGGTLNILGTGAAKTQTGSKTGGAGAVLATGENVVVNLYGGKFTGKGGSANALGAAAGATMKIYQGVNVSSGMLGVNGESTLEVYGGTLSTYIRSSGTAGTVSISGGNFTGTTYIFHSTRPTNSVITGGTFVLDPTAFVPTEGYVITVNEGVYTVAEKPFDGNAVNNADLVFAPETTKVLCPVCDEEVTWTKVTTDANITAAGHYYVTDEIAVSDADGILVNTTGKVCLHLGSAATVIQSSTDTGRSAITCSGGTLNILGTGAAKTQTGSKTGGAGAVLATGENVVVNLYGGKFTGKGGSANALGAAAGATMKIYQGANVSSGMLGVNGESTLEVYGGTLSTYIRSSGTAGTVSISGGSFTGTTYIFHATRPTNSVITGGTFVLDPTAFVPAQTHEVTTQTEGETTIYTVVEKVVSAAQLNDGASSETQKVSA